MFKTNWFIILFVARQSISISDSLNWTKSHVDTDLANFTLLIAREQLSKLSSTIVIAQHSERPETVLVNDYVVDFLLRNLQETVAVQLHVGNPKEQPWNYCILIVDSAEAFRGLLGEIQMNLNERHFHFLIVLTRYTSNFYDSLRLIFSLCYKFDVIDANIIVAHPYFGICMFTYENNTEDDCRIVHPVLRFIFSWGWERLRVVFHTKLTNLHGCPVTVTARPTSPLVKVPKKESHTTRVESWDNLSGIEVSILNLLAEGLNFKVHLLPIPQERSYIKNQTAYGCFRDLMHAKADIAIGAFSRSDPSRWNFTQTKLIHQTPYLYVVRGRPLSAFRRLGKPFNYRVWILVAFLFAFGLAFSQIFRFTRLALRNFILGPENNAPVVNLVATLLGNPTTRIPRRNFARYVLMLWFLLTLVLRNAYQGSLYDAFRMESFVQVPNGFHEIKKWNYKILVGAEMITVETFSKDHIDLIPVAGNHMQRFKILRQTREKYATVALRDNYLSYLVSTCRSDCDLIMINEVIYMYQVVMFLPKNSIYLKVFNRQLQRLAQAGLIRHVIDEFSIKPSFYKRVGDLPLKRPLSFNRLEAIYMIFLAMSMMATLVFCLELYSVYSARLRRMIEFVN